MNDYLLTRRRFIAKTLALSGWFLGGAAVACAPRFGRSAQRPLPMPNTNTGLAEIVSRKQHHGDYGFINPFNPQSPGKFSELVRWRLFSKNEFRAAYKKETVRPIAIDWEPIKAYLGLSVTFINHASVLIKDQDTCLLVDPVFNGLSFFIKDFTPLPSNLDGMPAPDHVLLTHGHYDHMDLPTLKHFDPNTHLVLPQGYHTETAALGFRRVTRLDWLENFTGDHRRITLLPCDHWTMRNPLIGPNRSLWGSFLIRTSCGRHIYLSGDTAYFNGFREIGAMADIDLAIINVSAYEPRWFMKTSHMNPAEAVRAFQELGAKRLMIVHWGTFRLGDEPVYWPPLEVREEMARAGLADRFIEIEHGQTLYM